MTLNSIFIITATIAIILTLLVVLIFKKRDSWLMSYVQNFCGAFFIFSGMVKAVDPLGLAYKMQDYFTEFEFTFEPTWFSFLAPLFPWLSSHAVAISVIVIVLEIVLGIMLIIGFRPKLTSWLFIGIVLFFTFLTGFTYLTGYVPGDVNFFQFGKWGPYVESNMKVQDCGCFGDFLKLKPRISFFKDLFLLIPAIYMIFFYNKAHQLFSKKMRLGVVSISTIALLVYCFSNFVWDIPHADFRPFIKGADVRNQRIAELDSLAKVELIGWEFEEIATGKKLQFMNPNYKLAVAEYSKEKGYKFSDQIQKKSTFEKTKISEYEISNFNGEDVTEELLNDPDVSIMIVSYRLKGDPIASTRMVRDTSYILDTIRLNADSMYVERKVKDITERTESYNRFEWNKNFIDAYKEKITPFVNDARANGIKTYAVFGGAEEFNVEQLKADATAQFDLYSADDILLKTIVRSNPGIVLWKDGKILSKWHYKKLPNFSQVVEEYLN